MSSSPESVYVVGVAWYTPDQWSLLKAFAADGEKLDSTHEAWLAGAQKVLGDLERRPEIQPRRVYVDVQELIAWCKESKRPFDSSARADFVLRKISRSDS